MKQRLQELAGIKVNELNVKYPLSKIKLIKQIISLNNYLLDGLVRYKTIDEFIKWEGYNSLEEYVNDIYGFGDPIKDKIINSIELYYKHIKPGEIISIDYEHDVSDFNIINLENFKNLILIKTDDKDLNYYYLTKF